MAKKNFSGRFWLIIALGLILLMPVDTALAAGWGRHDGRRGHEVYISGGRRYGYHVGRWYRPGGWFGLNFSFVFPPVGATVTYVPDRCRTLIIGGATYYEYDNVYYRACPTGYVVVPQPVETPNVIYVPSTTQPAASDRETVTINVPAANGRIVAITLVRYPNGFVGPQGEFYPTLPTAEQLRERYGR